MLGVETDELSFGPSTTPNTYVLAQAFREGWRRARRSSSPIRTTRPIRAMARLAERWHRDAGMAHRPETGLLDPAGLETLLDDGKVRLVCLSALLQHRGRDQPGDGGDRRRPCRRCLRLRRRGQLCAARPSQRGRAGADIYLFSAYKTYGPHQGLMVMRRALGELLPNQAHWFNAGTLYKRFTPAGPDHAQVAASCRDGRLHRRALQRITARPRAMRDPRGGRA
jgi:hypothetical protein